MAPLMPDGCAAGSLCAGKGAPSWPAVGAEAEALCDWCLRAAAADIAALPRDYADLAAELVPAQRAMGQRVACTDTEGAVPLALDIEALQREMFWTLTTWEPAVREAARLAPETTRGVRDGWAVAAAARVIAPRVAVLARIGPVWCYAEGLDVGPVLRDGVQAIGALRAVHRRARAACGVTRRVYEMPGYCSGCGAYALRRADGSDTVRCAVCDRRWTYDDYHRYVGLTLSGGNP